MNKFGFLVFLLVGFCHAKNLNIMDIFQNNEIDNVRQDPPPDYKQYAKMARYLVHNSGT